MKVAKVKDNSKKLIWMSGETYLIAFIMHLDFATATRQDIEESGCSFSNAELQPCNSQYREHTGRCSNTEDMKKTWGMAGTPFTRVLWNRYEDGTQIMLSFAILE